MKAEAADPDAVERDFGVVVVGCWAAPMGVPSAEEGGRQATAGEEDSMGESIVCRHTLEEFPVQMMRSVIFNESELFLPANVILFDKERGSEIWYQMGEARALSEVENLAVYDLLEVLADVLNGVLRAEQNFLFPGEYAVNAEQIYVTEGEDGKLFAGLVYEPLDVPEEPEAGVQRVRDAICDILAKQKQRMCPEGARSPLGSVYDRGIAIVERRRSGIAILQNRLRSLAEECRATEAVRTIR